MKTSWSWTPPALMAIAAFFTVGVDTQHSMDLRQSLADVIPEAVLGHSGADVAISPAELEVAGVTDYLMREYAAVTDSGPPSWASLYIGYYDRQVRGKTIHSPKNCLPGAGWEVLASTTAAVPRPEGDVEVNRYLLQKGDQAALVLYWYQGRGRIQYNEYLVKWDLLKDSALKQRSDEALVRIVVPITSDEAHALDLATDIAAIVASRLDLALPL